jgi:hypothetical protein
MEPPVGGFFAAQRCHPEPRAVSSLPPLVEGDRRFANITTIFKGKEKPLSS